MNEFANYLWETPFDEISQEVKEKLKLIGGKKWINLSTIKTGFLSVKGKEEYIKATDSSLKCPKCDKPMNNTVYIKIFKVKNYKAPDGFEVIPTHIERFD